MEPFEVEAIVLARQVRRVWPDAKVMGGPNVLWRIGIAGAPGEPPTFLTRGHALSWFAWREAWEYSGTTLGG
ncbi:MAG: hypothetical protein FJZ00_00460 [Candidatus Sericytochromatia bacterium]|uniref:Uncharacterized protein n=1 Tax=Candidatus Tanganyikabacteria bacterium TaxID=2961651 RepID=A0A937X2G6_9BACT|nr:hypothetical protein [Candidatus Tanganyikabacteria bacterium]